MEGGRLQGHAEREGMERKGGERQVKQHHYQGRKPVLSFISRK